MDLLRVHGVLNSKDQHVSETASGLQSGASDPPSPHGSSLDNGNTVCSGKEGEHAQLEDFIHPLFQILLTQPHAYIPHQTAYPQQPERSPTVADASFAPSPQQCAGPSEELGEGSPQANTDPFSFPRRDPSISCTPQLICRPSGSGNPVTPFEDAGTAHGDAENGDEMKTPMLGTKRELEASVTMRSARKRQDVDYSALASGRPTHSTQLLPTLKRKQRPPMVSGQDHRVSPAALAVAGAIAAGMASNT